MIRTAVNFCSVKCCAHIPQQLISRDHAKYEHFKSRVRLAGICEILCGSSPWQYCIEQSIVASICSIVATEQGTVMFASAAQYNLS